jgi:SET domain-containing protein
VPINRTNERIQLCCYAHSKDILKKEEIKLDWNFKWSMLNDLVRVSQLFVII